MERLGKDKVEVTMQHPKVTIRAFLLFSSVVLNVAAILFFGQMAFAWASGRRYDPSQARDLGDLRRIIYSVKPLQSALEDHSLQHRLYPDQLDVLARKLKERHYLDEMARSGVVPQITAIQPEGSGYQIYIKLGRDPGLHYYSSSDEWIYDPGDGSETTVIEP